MYTVLLSKHFKRSFKKLGQSGKFSKTAVDDYKSIVTLLKAGEALPRIYRDHALAGEFLGYRECHIKGDMLLIYQHHEDTLILLLLDIGSHSQLFG